MADEQNDSGNLEPQQEKDRRRGDLHGTVSGGGHIDPRGGQRVVSRADPGE